MANQLYTSGGYGLVAQFPYPVFAPRDPTSLDTVSPTGQSYIPFQEWQNTMTLSLFIYASDGIWVEISPSGTGPITEINVQTGISPVIGTGGVITFNGAVVGAGTTPVQTDGTATSTMALQVQLSQAISSPNLSNVGLSAFNSAQFIVDNMGFVSSKGSGFNYTNVTNSMSPYTVLTSDFYLSVDCSAGAVTLEFPNTPVANQIWIVKDRTGSASTHNISIATPGATVTIDGLTTYKITSNYGAVNLLANATPTYEVF